MTHRQANKMPPLALVLALVLAAKGQNTDGATAHNSTLLEMSTPSANINSSSLPQSTGSGSTSLPTSTGSGSTSLPTSTGSGSTSLLQSMGFQSTSFSENSTETDSTPLPQSTGSGSTSLPDVAPYRSTSQPLTSESESSLPEMTSQPINVSRDRALKDAFPETTTVIPDVTATSQSISLLTTPPPVTVQPPTRPPTTTTTNLTTTQQSSPTALPEPQQFQLIYSAPCRDLDDVIDVTFCEHLIKVQVRVHNSTGLEDLLSSRLNWTLLRIDPLTSNASDFAPTLFSGILFSSREIITYAVVGGVFGLAIVLVTALLCCKCCCRPAQRQDKDIPHLTLRLEDYSLTRIPRPTTLFGVDRPSQPFDTCVVPVDQDYGPRPDLNTFNGKKHRSTDTDEDLYSRPGSVLSGSRERLARDFERYRAKRLGNDNQVFRF